MEHDLSVLKESHCRLSLNCPANAVQHTIYHVSDYAPFHGLKHF